QRTARTGITIAHCGHSFVEGAVVQRRRAGRLGGRQRRYEAPDNVTNRSSKLTRPSTSPIGGIRMSFTNDVTMAPKAAPITTATARSTTLPRIRNARKSLSIAPPPLPVAGSIATAVYGGGTPRTLDPGTPSASEQISCEGAGPWLHHPRHRGPSRPPPGACRRADDVRRPRADGRRHSRRACVCGDGQDRS